jgi:sigma-B regulation protein RsbU (phosphoserine phosphatase)
MVRIPPTLQGLDSWQLSHVAAVGRQTSLSIHLHLLIEELRANERLQREIEIAREIQNNLLPQTTPSSPYYDLHAGCITAARVGGDYYDFFEDEVGPLGILIADVAGHSVASALMAMSFRTSFRLFLEQKIELRSLFEKTNAALYKELCQSGSFLSAFYGILDEPSRTFRYVNGGHNYPLHWSGKAGVFNELDQAGLLIGILPDSEYSVAEVTVSAGDILLFYTDGIVEAENQHGEFFGMERLQQAVRKNAKKSSRQLYHSILKEMYLFQDEEVNKDDVTLIVLEIKER